MRNDGLNPMVQLAVTVVILGVAFDEHCVLIRTVVTVATHLAKGT